MARTAKAAKTAKQRTRKQIKDDANWAQYSHIDYDPAAENGNTTGLADDSPVVWTDERPTSVPDILADDAGLYNLKSADYNAGDDPNENLKFAAMFAHRVCADLEPTDPRWATAVLVGVKFARLMALKLNGKPANEPVRDTLRDLRVYLAMLEQQSL